MWVCFDGLVIFIVKIIFNGVEDFSGSGGGCQEGIFRPRGLKQHCPTDFSAGQILNEGNCSASRIFRLRSEDYAPLRMLQPTRG